MVLLIPWAILTFFEDSSSESDPGALSFLDPLKKKDFLLVVPKNFFFFGEKDDAWREVSELRSIPMATRAFQSGQKQLMNRSHLSIKYHSWSKP